MAKREDEGYKKGLGVTFKIGPGQKLMKDSPGGKLYVGPKKKAAPASDKDAPAPKGATPILPPRTPTPKPIVKPEGNVTTYENNPYKDSPKITGENIPPVGPPPSPPASGSAQAEYDKLRKDPKTYARDYENLKKYDRRADQAWYSSYGENMGAAKKLAFEKSPSRFRPAGAMKNGGKVRGDGMARIKTKGRSI